MAGPYNREHKIILNNAIQMLFLTVFNVALFSSMFILNYIVRNGTSFLMIHLFEIMMTFFLYFNNLGLENNFLKFCFNQSS